MSVQEFNDEAERVRKAKQTQIAASVLYPIGIKEIVFRSAERTSVQSRREELDYADMKAQLVHDKQVVTDTVCTYDRHSVQVALLSATTTIVRLTRDLNSRATPAQETPLLSWWPKQI